MSKIDGIEASSIVGLGSIGVGGGAGTATTTPTFTKNNATTYLQQGITITNTGSYTDPTYQVIVTVDGGTLYETVTQDSVINWTDNDTSTSTRTISVKAQEFGDYIQSTAATDTYTRTDLNFRYYRLYGGSSTSTKSTGWVGFYEFRLYEGASRTGTKHPENLTSNTSGEANGYYVDSTYAYNSTTYAKWKAFDNNLNTWHWTLSVSSAADNFAGFHFDATSFPTPPSILSLQFRSYGNPAANYAILEGSNTGAWTGEETKILDIDMTSQVSATYYNIG